MKKLVCGNDIEDIVEKGLKKFYIDKNTIITPLAIEKAKLYDIEIIENENIETIENKFEEKDMELIYKLFKGMEDKGFLIELLKIFNKEPYEVELDETGLRVVKGSSIELKKVETDNPNDLIFTQRLTEENSTYDIGLLKIENSELKWNLKVEETFYVIDGKVDIYINNRKYEVLKGDLLTIPKDAKVSVIVMDKVEFLYIKNVNN